MKKYLLTILPIALFALFTPSAQALDEGESQISGSVNYFLPSSDFYDFGLGLDLKYGIWQRDDKAYFATLGFHRWASEGQASVNRTSGGAEGVALDGDVNLIPIGISAIWRNETDYSRFLDISLEVGAKYVLANSDANAQAVAIASNGTRASENRSVKVDNNVIAVVAIELDYLLSDENDLVFGVGYNFDLLKGDIKAGDVKIDDHELQGLFFNIGLAHRF